MIRPLVSSSSFTLPANEPNTMREKVAAAFHSLGWVRFPLLMLVGVFGLFLGEVGSFKWALRRCRFHDLSDQAQVFVAVSDVHILGTLKTDLDIAWTTWQVRKSLVFVMEWIRPSAFFILGDHLDQGGYAPQEDWNLYVERYKWATEPLRHYKGARIVDSVMGNHDAQFAHLGLTQEMLDRFVRAFGEVNGRIRLGPNVEAIWINALALYDEGRSAAHESAMQLLEELESEDPREAKPFRILLSHVPAFRVNDLDCGKSRLREKAHVTYVAPEEPLKSGFDVLSPETSQQLLNAVRPDVMLSGHLHSHCYRKNQFEDRVTMQNTSFLDISVPSFSYRMRPDPGLTLVAVDHMQAHGKTCKLPNERVVLAFDIVSLLIIGYAALMWLFECRFCLLGRRPLKVE